MKKKKRRKKKNRKHYTKNIEISARKPQKIQTEKTRKKNIRKYHCKKKEKQHMLSQLEHKFAGDCGSTSAVKIHCNIFHVFFLLRH